jgi:hypothetical protein
MVVAGGPLHLCSYGDAQALMHNLVVNPSHNSASHETMDTQTTQINFISPSQLRYMGNLDLMQISNAFYPQVEKPINNNLQQ